MSSEPVARRRPRQARGRARVDQLLDTAAALLQAEGYAALTTNRIAAEAGMAVGSLYQYFANKEDLVQALALRALARLDAELDRVLPADEDFSWEETVDRVLDAMAALYRREPGFQAVWLGPDVSAELVAADRAHDEELIARLAPLLGRALQGASPARRKLVAEVVVQVGGAILSLATRQSPRRAARVIAEGKAMIKSYLRQAGAEGAK